MRAAGESGVEMLALWGPRETYQWLRPSAFFTACQWAGRMIALSPGISA